MIDLYTREVTGHAMAEHMRADLVCDAIDLAAGRGLTSHDAIFHSDRGSQYTSATFRATLAAADIRPSMGRVGTCYDNPVAESFFATLKTEIGNPVWATRYDARRAVFAYLGYYNHDRLHSTLDYRTPHETRISYRQETALAAYYKTLVSGSRGEPQFEYTVQSGRGGSRLDVFACGPVQEIIEFGWETTWRSALSTTRRPKIVKHANQVGVNFGQPLSAQTSILWVDLVRSHLDG